MMVVFDYLLAEKMREKGNYWLLKADLEADCSSPQDLWRDWLLLKSTVLKFRSMYKSKIASVHLKCSCLPAEDYLPAIPSLPAK